MKKVFRVKYVLAAICAIGLFGGKAFAYTDKVNTTITRLTTATFVNGGTTTSLLMIRLASGHSGEPCGNLTDWAIVYQGAGQIPESLMSVAMSHYLSGRPITVKLNGCQSLPTSPAGIGAWGSNDFFGNASRPVVVLLSPEN